MSLRLDHAEISGTFSLDGETHDVDNNLWVIGDDEECLVIDAPHDVDAILEVIGGRITRGGRGGRRVVARFRTRAAGVPGGELR